MSSQLFTSHLIAILPVNPGQWAPWLILIGMSLSIFIISSVICKKTGLHSSNSTICLIPIIGPFVFFWIIAFSKWPIHDKLPDNEESNTEEQEQTPQEMDVKSRRKMKKRKKR